MKVQSTLRPFILAAALAILSACGGGGGGGGGGSFVGAAEVSVRIEPSRIDQGDRALVQIELANVHANGILLKIRFPKGLEYVRNSGQLEVEDADARTLNPVDNVTVESDVYLVFNLPQALLGDENRGVLNLQLEGKDGVPEDSLEIDPDVNDPSTPDEREFNANNPEFQVEDSTSIEVQG